MSRYVKQLIQQGEHQQLDFKFEVSDSRKIARTLAAFANSEGGTLLIGVKDNGSVTGIHTDEEYYMIESAASMYCQPPVDFSVRKWSVDGKIVLEVKVPPMELEQLIKAPDKRGKYMVYVRVNDQNLLANRIMLKSWNMKKRKQGILIRFAEEERKILQILESEKSASFQRIKETTGISYFKLENLLAKLHSIGIIKILLTEKKAFYSIVSTTNKESLL